MPLLFSEQWGVTPDPALSSTEQREEHRTNTQGQSLLLLVMVLE